MISANASGAVAPRRRASPARRSTPSRFAPFCASRSPRRSAGVRELDANLASTAAVRSIGGSRSPSSSISTASGGIEPGAMPPRSAWCARFAAQPTSRSSTKHGATRVTSLRCVPPANGSLSTICSPAPTPSSAVASIAARTAAGIEPRCTGMCSACTSSSPSAANSAAEQSARSLMLGLYAARRSTPPISSAMPTRREINTCNDAGSSLIDPRSAGGSRRRADRVRPSSRRAPRPCSRLRRRPVDRRPGDERLPGAPRCRVARRGGRVRAAR